MAFEKVSALLPTVKNRVKDGSGVEAALVVRIANQVLRNVYDEELWDLVRVVYFKNGALIVSVPSSVVGHAIKMQERKLCEAVGKQVGVEVKGILIK